MQRLLSVTKALADRNRLRALVALGRGELCVCQITELLGLAPSTVSKHLSILQQAGLVASRKEGRWIHYRLAKAAASPPPVAGAIRWVRSSVAKDEEIRRDARRLRQIKAMNPEELCRKQCGR